MVISFENDRFDLVIGGKRLFFTGMKLSLSDGRELRFSDFTIEQKKDFAEARSVCGDLTLEYKFACSGEFAKICAAVENKGPDIRIDRFDILGPISSESFELFDRVMVTGQTMIGVEGVLPLDRSRSSASYMALTDAMGNRAFLAGFTDSRKTYHEAANDFESKTLRGIGYRNSTPLRSGERLEISPFVMGFNKSLNALLSAYADELAADGEACVPKELKTGWCSWYYYYSFETQEDIIKNIEMLKRSPIGDKIRVIQIDDGWNQVEPNAPHNWGDWHAGVKFPDGMKKMADIIHSYGYEAGIWLAPFTAASSSELIKAHPDWVLRENAVNTLGAVDYGLDLTNPEVLDFIRETFERVFNDWGYDYIKIDFLIMSLQNGKRYNPDITYAESYYNALKMIKDIAADRFVLTCGPAVFQSVGVTDGIRIGPDVGNRWLIPAGWKEYENGNCAIKPAMYHTLWRNWMHNKLWHNDADCLMARHSENKYDKRPYGDTIFGCKWSEELLGIDDNAFGSWIRTLWFTSNMLLLSEVWDELLPERQALITECFSPLKRPVGYVDCYADPEVVLMKTADEPEADKPLMLAVFNMSDKTVEPAVPSDVIGAREWSFTERFSGESFSGSGLFISFPKTAAHESKIWVLENSASPSAAE